MGGGTSEKLEEEITIRGLSPRGRGNLPHNRIPAAHHGSIPAWAGEPHVFLCDPTQSRVYPRVGGGTVPPRGRNRSPVGLSPRGRGNRGPAAPGRHRRRSIPAWAGEPALDSVPFLPPQVYPRVGGGTWLKPIAGNHNIGLSPAWAGEPPASPTRNSSTRVYPRVGGGTYTRDVTDTTYNGLSPRGRGNLALQTAQRRARGSIPAWAGEPITPEPLPAP